jgi:hypothetical protein
MHHRHIPSSEPLGRYSERRVDGVRIASATELVRTGPRLLIERKNAGARRGWLNR